MSDVGPLEGRPGWAGDRLIAAIVAGSAFALYLGTASRTITWEHGGADGAELAAAAYVLGVGHPSGYPLYLLLANLFTHFPLGEVAFRVTLLSAVAAAAGAALGALASSALAAFVGAGRGAAAIVGGVATATLPLYWSQATITEVYALHAALVMGAFVLVARWRRGRDLLLVAAAGLVGLGMGNHLTLAAVAPALALVVALEDPGFFRRRALLAVALAGIMGLAVYAYLPIRASTDPPINWGNPATLDRFIEQVSGRSYWGYFHVWPPEDLAARASAAARMLGDQLTWPGLALAIAGGLGLAGTRPALVLGLVFFAALNLGFALLYWAKDGEVYLLPVYLTLVLLLAVEAGSLMTPPRRGWIGFALAILVLWRVGSLVPDLDLRDNEAAARYARDTLAAAAPGDIVRAESDEHSFALTYVQTVEGARPDVVVLDTRLAGLPWYREQLTRRFPDRQIPFGTDGQTPEPAPRDGGERIAGLLPPSGLGS